MKADTLTVSNFDQLKQAVASRAKTIEVKDFDTTGETTAKLVITGLTIVHDIFGNKNSAIYLADGSYVEISGNTIDAALTGFPMSPIGLATTLDKLTEDVKVSPVVITHNKVTSIYVTKMYASGTLFGEDGNILKDDNDFGVREALSKFLVELEKNNTFTLKEGYPVEHESGYVQCRLDKIMSGGTYYEKNVFFNVTDGKRAAVPAPAEG